MLRYGRGLAYAPHSIHLDIVSDASDGSTPIQYLLWVTDIAGQNVTAGQTLCHCPIDVLSSTHVLCAQHSDSACLFQQPPFGGSLGQKTHVCPRAARTPITAGHMTTIVFHADLLSVALPQSDCRNYLAPVTAHHFMLKKQNQYDAFRSDFIHLTEH